MKIENLMMPWIPMSKCVRQGSPLSLLLFNTFLTLINLDHLSTTLKTKVRLYADDIVAICPSLAQAEKVDEYMRRTSRDTDLR
jgi:hypothetical protein